MNDSELIDDLGGPAALAERLGYPKHNGVQRVQNWKVRGIPARVKLDRPDLFLRDRSAPANSAPTPASQAA
jgi:hypothetical protein